MFTFSAMNSLIFPKTFTFPGKPITNPILTAKTFQHAIDTKKSLSTF